MFHVEQYSYKMIKLENKNCFLEGKVVDIWSNSIFAARISISGGKIESIEKIPSAPDRFILPGLIDAHIHIESSMVTPGAFALAAVRHGTTSVVSDPHEIANVLGVEGVHFMIRDAENVPLKFNFGAPSCVPATAFETNGASIGAEETRVLLELKEIKYLSEMMNYPGVIFNDAGVHDKLEQARRVGKPVDGHAPGLHGEMLRKYVFSGISTDHECSTIDEALEKISLGMKILIREGSAARNLEALKDLYKSNPGMLMLCSDDLHPEMLQVRHINKLIASLISEGYNVFDVMRSATLNPARHYNLDAGLLQAGDSADITVVDTLESMNVLETWIDGKTVYKDGQLYFGYSPGEGANKFNCCPVNTEMLRVSRMPGMVRVMTSFEGELLTGEYLWTPADGKYVLPETDKDILKIVVKDRYNDQPPVIGFIRGFGLVSGAFASSIAHDSHNIICIGTNDDDIVSAINEVISLRGGLATASGKAVDSLQLDIAGIMSTRSCDDIANRYLHLSDLVRSWGCTMKAPFMTLSFMALLVIPELKIGDKGLFDVRKFTSVSLFV